MAEKRLTVNPTKTFRAPGDDVTATALGYLHANCGNCHNAYGIKFINPFRMRLSVFDTTPESTDTWKTAVNVPVEKFVLPGVERRIAPKNPTGSCVHQRMSIRGTTQQMPPIATKIVDDAGVAKIAAWIDTLPP